MSKYDWNLKLPDWNFTLPESFFKTQEVMNGLAASALAMSDAWKNAIPHYDFSGVQAALNAYTENLRSISEQIAPVSSIAKSIPPLIDKSAFDTLKYASQATKALQNVDWGAVVNAYAETFESENDDQETSESVSEEALTPEIRAEIAADITEVLSNPEELQSASQSKYLRWKERNPGVAAFFLDILYPLLLVLIAFLLQNYQARLDKDSQVYAEPTATSNVVYNLTVENHITIIGEAPYYYEVEFVNPETGEPVTGYVYKGNVTVEEPEETVTQEETEDTEGGETAEVSETVPNATASPTETTE